jgi:hypothetical protein
MRLELRGSLAGGFWLHRHSALLEKMRCACDLVLISVIRCELHSV